MTTRAYIWKTLLITAAASTSLMGAVQPAFAARADDALYATPPGITLQDIPSGGRRGGGDGDGDGETAAKPDAKAEASTEPKPLPFLNGGNFLRVNGAITFADEHGKTLYTYAKDIEPGRSACVDKCAETWPPALVPAGAKFFGDWGSIIRADKTRQWTYKGKPLYTFVKDTGANEKKGDGLADGAWKMAKYDPAAELTVPYGMNVHVSDYAAGYVLTDESGMTIYAFDGKPPKAAACITQTCPDHWSPVLAATLANPNKDFTLVEASDGSRQWAFRGKPLFTYGGDHAAGDANGIGVDKHYQPAYVSRFPTPAQASIAFDNSRGPIVTTATGMTLYRRDTSYHQPDGHGLPGSTPGNSIVGRAMGTRSCIDACLVDFKPLVPPAKALPSGFWDIYTRADGTRQWAYKGFAMYTYVGDKAPGDKTGHEIYELRVSENPAENIYDTGVVPNATAATLFWAYAEP